MSSRPLWILGDLHVGEDETADRDLLRLLAEAAAQQVDLLLMGDLFVAWLGPERFWPHQHRPVLEGLRAIRRARGRVRLVVGNRDYLAEALVGDVFDEVFTEPRALRIGDQSTWVLHGDGIVPEDRAYRAWRSISRSRWAAALLSALPSAWGRRLPVWMSRQMAPTNRRFKTNNLPASGLRAVATAAKAGGARRCLMGHFHTPADVTVDSVRIVVVPGWAEHRTVVMVSDDGQFIAKSPWREVG